jgi:hypothetical protein
MSPLDPILICQTLHVPWHELFQDVRRAFYLGLLIPDRKAGPQESECVALRQRAQQLEIELEQRDRLHMKERMLWKTRSEAFASLFAQAQQRIAACESVFEGTEISILEANANWRAYDVLMRAEVEKLFTQVSALDDVQDLPDDIGDAEGQLVFRMLCDPPAEMPDWFRRTAEQAVKHARIFVKWALRHPGVEPPGVAHHHDAGGVRVYVHFWRDNPEPSACLVRLSDR